MFEGATICSRRDRSLDPSGLASIWPNYFPDIDLSTGDPRFKLVGKLAEFLSNRQADGILSQVQDDNGTFFLPVDIQHLQKICNIADFYGTLEKAPKEALSCMGAAVHTALLLKEKDFQFEGVEKINIRLYNYTDSMIALKNLKAAYIGRLVSVRGTVVKVSTVRPLVLQMEFECGKCGTNVPRIFPDGKFSPPTSCVMYGCKSKNFLPIRSSAKPIDFQKIRLQEMLKSESHEEGRVPRTVECELAEDLVDACIPGDVVTVTGVIKVINNYMDIGGAGLTLALFGGVQKHSMDQNKVPVRGDIHVIIVGDPGLGKSQLLQAAAALSPRGIYVCGNATTKAGLTVAVVKDHMTSDYAFEAGAMVLADRGLCCIDEFDKMSAEHQALLEAMEQQRVSVAKAGLVASLSARTSVLAAANPVGGHYNRAKTVNENLKMSAALLSRFDLVFILLDKPDEVLDKRVSDHIMALHTGNGDHLLPNKKLRRAFDCNGDNDFGVKKGSLVSQLRLDPQKDKDFVPLPGPLLRKYIAYARNFIFPKMSRPAAEILQKFYLRLRDHNTSADGTPITARQLESLVRLAEARARVDLREEITAQDAMDVVEIMKESLYDKYVDEHGFVDFARSGGMSQQKEAKRFLSALNKQSELQQKDCFSISEIYSLADRISLRVPDMDTFVENLNSVGYLLKKGPKMYQVLSSSYSRSQPTRSRC
ncbi:probable DNA helicase MCM8 isoform X3 [Asparagus officinalis]|uniref:probable DNA helicase MCM8 isoform X3 n=1 Tax=Asparagus officinalis TaxID=4686 RepID=UPI00098E5894|nr:probable DNA helicase MCM8 isoform X3 [Asparagus officinalis]